MTDYLFEGDQEALIGSLAEKNNSYANISNVS